MFNFIRHKGRHFLVSDKQKATKRESLESILKILSVCEGTTTAQAAKFSKEDPVTWSDEKVNEIYKKLKLMKF